MKPGENEWIGVLHPISPGCELGSICAQPEDGKALCFHFIRDDWNARRRVYTLIMRPCQLIPLPLQMDPDLLEVNLNLPRVSSVLNVWVVHWFGHSTSTRCHPHGVRYSKCTIGTCAGDIVERQPVGTFHRQTHHLLESGTGAADRIFQLAIVYSPSSRRARSDSEVTKLQFVDLMPSIRK